MTETSSGPAVPGAGIPAAPGRLVAGHYRLLRELGCGGMGVVWLAEDELLDRQVAVKELRPPRGLDDESLARLRERALREARSAASIRHPNAVALYNIIPPSEDDDAVYLIMEYVDGPTLAGLIRRHGPMPAPWVGRIGLQMLDVLQAAHALGLVHRDVKPGNILIGRDGQAKLTDFGIAHSIGDLRLTTDGIMGTQAYLAPELFQPGPITTAVDLWSLGATLCCAAEGRAPFERGSIGETLSAILFQPLPTMHCDPGVAGAIYFMLQRDPAERATIEEARARLMGYGMMPGMPWSGPLPVPSPQPAPATAISDLPSRAGSALSPTAGSVRAAVGVLPPLPPNPPT
jgi:serine/threonine protein kinase